MLIRLQTRCGCVRLQFVSWKHFQEHYEVAILPDVDMRWVRDASAALEMKPIHKRRFSYRGEDHDGIPIYLEGL